MSTTPTDQTSLKVDAPPASVKRELKPIVFDAPRDYQLTRDALAHRAENLKAVVKKTATEGYPKQAREIQADAERIEFGLLTRFNAQPDLPIVLPVELAEQITAALSPIVAVAFDSIGGKSSVKLTDAMIKYRKQNLLKAITDRVLSFATLTARTAYDAGYAQSRTTPELFAMKEIDALRGGRAD